MRKCTKLTAVLLALLTSASVAAHAMVLETVETAAESVSPPPTSSSLADDIDISAVDSTYGDLIYYATYENENTTASLISSEAFPVSASPENVTSVIADNPNGDGTKVLQLTATGDYPCMTLNTQFLQAGDYTIMVDLYFPASNTKPGAWSRAEYKKSNGDKASDVWDWTKQAAVNGEWKTFVWTVTADGSDDKAGLHNLAARAACGSGDVFYYDNLRLYLNPKVGDDQVRTVDSTSATVTTFTEEDTTFTFPTPSVTTDFLAWRDSETGKTYRAGAVVAKGDVAGKCFTAFYDIGYPLADDEYGDLIYLADYENGETTAASYSNAKYPVKAAGTAVTISNADNPNGDGTKSLKLVATGGYSGVQLHPQFDGVGEYTIVVDLWFPEGTATPGVLGRMQYSNGGSDAWQSPWKAYATATGEWQTYSWTVKADGSDKKTGLQDLAARRYANDSTPYYYDNLRLYYNPRVADTQVRLVDDGFSSLITLTGESYTFPAPTDSTDFLAWYDKDSGKTYKSGETASVSEIGGKSFVAFHQSAEQPAMGFAYEGEFDAWKDGSLLTYKTQKDGPTSVWNLVLTPGWIEGSSVWKSDDRIFITSIYTEALTAFDPKEYNLVSYRYKVNKALKAPNVNPVSEDEITELTQPKFIMDYFASNNYSGFYTPGGEHFIKGTQTVPSVGEYHIFNADMSVASNGVSGCPWNSVEQIYGFSLQLPDANYGFDLDIDYLRVYRDGISTVTYNTNVPEDATTSDILHTVSPDTGRGVGKGYLLTGEEPVIDGYTFLGWAESADATANDVVTSIDLTGDKTVYAVWVADDAPVPETIEKNSLRTSGPMGLRFASLMYLDIKRGLGDSDAALAGVTPDAYGFIVSRKSLLNGTDLNFGRGPADNGSGTTRDGVMYVSGLAYDKAKGIDKVYDADGSVFSEVEAGVSEAFTAVLLNIPSTAYGDVLVARPFVRFGDLYFYGTTREASMRAVALEMNEHFDSLSDAEQSVVTEILTATGDMAD